MTDREAMKLALDALENHTVIKHPQQMHYRDTAIEALRQALAEPDMGIDRGAWDDVPDATKWVDELRGGDETEREWVGLTDEDIAEGAKQSWVDKQAFESVAWWAEEKLKEKNHGNAEG